MKKEKLFSKENLMFKLLLATCFATVILLPTILLANTTLEGNAALGGFEGFTSYITTGLKYFKWVAAIFGGILLIFAFVEFMADNTQVTRLITKLVVCVFCLGLAFGVEKFMKALGGSTIDMQKYQIEKLEKTNSKFKISNYELD